MEQEGVTGEREFPADACRHLRCKAMYYAGRLPQISDTTCFWCLRTMDALGPDREAVDDRRCMPGRECYEPRT
jgi:hypothetical protein